MKLSLISGKFGGRLINAPDGKLTHPMSSRVRGSLFNIINNELDGTEVLDVFAGTGSLGLEAISRGAKHVTFIERDRAANRILVDNITTLGVGDFATVFQIGAKTWTDKNQDKSFDIIFADPPYNNLQLSTVFSLIGLLKPNGLMVLSYPGRGELPTVQGVVVVDNRSYGTAALTFYRRK
ncbi:MAG TPA: 16S rRNA (guanine(966)-N(2))-methyltransferase RsmD [Candidatus Saccharimonadales bacterium]|nr:16S rRNA (guanine(966)-N(2))-methyltransferase RsmD [Candidatus Saccharimonadales bacterium]